MNENSHYDENISLLRRAVQLGGDSAKIGVVSSNPEECEQIIKFLVDEYKALHFNFSGDTTRRLNSSLFTQLAEYVANNNPEEVINDVDPIKKPVVITLEDLLKPENTNLWQSINFDRPKMWSFGRAVIFVMSESLNREFASKAADMYLYRSGNTVIFFDGSFEPSKEIKKRAPAIER